MGLTSANDIKWVVKRKGNADASRLAGKRVRLRFALKDTHLYAFQFAGNPESGCITLPQALPS